MLHNVATTLPDGWDVMSIFFLFKLARTVGEGKRAENVHRKRSRNCWRDAGRENYTRFT